MRFISLRLGVAALLLAGLVPTVDAQRDWDHARGLVGKAQQDLQNISSIATMSGKERERYDNALHHLSEFDQALSHSHFDKGKLDTSVDDIDNVCKNNTLTPNERDVLLADIRELRHLKSDWKD
jgi:hypothetical protein